MKDSCNLIRKALVLTPIWSQKRIQQIIMKLQYECPWQYRTPTTTGCRIGTYETFTDQRLQQAYDTDLTY